MVCDNDRDRAGSASQRSQEAKKNCCLQPSLLEQIETRIRSRDYWFSLEFFPPRTVNGAANLCGKFEALSRGGPLFCDITWHNAGDPSSKEKPTSSLMMANIMLNYCGLQTMLHITCYGQQKEKLRKVLEDAKNFGISNILGLRGDPPKGQKWVKDAGDFNYGAEFVRFIRQEFPDSKDLVIGVTGYPPPHGHPEATSYADDLVHLKEKIDAGANLIITQLFFKAEDFVAFVKDCRSMGVTCPIIPGIFPIQAYQSVVSIISLVKSELPTDAMAFIEENKKNDEVIRNFGIDFCVKMCRELLASGVVFGLHFYTLNRDVATIAILKQLGLWQELSAPRQFPWSIQTANPNRRKKEDVRPIFWSNHPRSYLYRTLNWDEFPNGRWGDSFAASFGDFNHHAFYVRHLEAKDDSSKHMLEMWGESLETEQDVWDVFTRFIAATSNKKGKAITRLPWSETENLSLETSLLTPDLIAINSGGILTINSQPRANGLESNDPVFGWGSDNGVVYQKAYLEFFMPKEYVSDLLSVLARYPLVHYHIVDSDVSTDLTNQDAMHTNAITWGVFPGREIVQPTVVDPEAFRVWKKEAFSIWLNVWADLYPAGSQSQQILRYCHDNYCLVNLVDNQFNRPTSLFQICREVLKTQNYDPTESNQRIVPNGNGTDSA